jgi:hypothetical protein
VIASWADPFDLTTPVGTLNLNQTYAGTNRRFQLVPTKCNAALPVRTTQDDVPQGDGAIPHRRWRSGFGVHLAVEMLIDDGGGQMSAACDLDLIEMLDLLGAHVNAMIRTGLVSGFPNARLVWKLSSVYPGVGDRMFDRIQLSTGGAVTLEGDIGTLVEFDVDTPYPYYIEASETDTVLGETGVEIVTNAGNTDYFPVVQIFGPTPDFILKNHSVVDLDGNPLELDYIDSLPGAVAIGGGDYVEFNFFTGEAFLNGSGANRKAGIDFRWTEFFPLVPGENILSLIGATGIVLSNGAFA